MIKSSSFNLSEVVSQAQAHDDPFYLHGTLCGILCIRENQAIEDWIQELAPDTGAEERKRLVALLELTQQQLDSPDLDLRLLLPADQQPLRQRTEALAGWSRGFLYGVGSDALEKETFPDADAQEFLGDVARIADAEHRSNEDTREDETAYYEIVEYLRMGLLLVYESLHPRT